MPELLEVERYRAIAEAVVGLRIKAVEAPDEWFVKGGATPESVIDALAGRRVVAARRHGKLLCLDTDGPVLGIRFGMTGRLVVAGRLGIDQLQYGPARMEPRWDRFGLVFGRGQRLRVNDPRRLGGVELDPAEERLGPDAVGLGAPALAAALGRSAAPLKARLMDQAVIAGLGNLLVDEILWRAGLDPARPARSVRAAQVRRLAEVMASTLAELDERGGSHRGDLQDERVPDGRCPRDGARLQRRTVGGRTTYSCPRHQH